MESIRENSNQKKKIKKIIAGFTAAVFFYTTVATPLAEAGFWEDRQQSVGQFKKTNGSSSVSDNTQIASLPQALRVSQPLTSLNMAGHPQGLLHQKWPKEQVQKLPKGLQNLPSSYGNIRNIHLSKNPDAPMMVLIQDAHGLYNAQKNIAGILEHVASSEGDQPLLIGMEGSVGAYDLERFRGLKHQDVQKEINEFFLQNIMINGGEYYGLNAEKAPLLWGIETEEFYMKNVYAYRHGQEIAEEMETLQADIKKIFDAAKQTLLNKNLLKLDNNLQKYNEGEMGMVSFLAYLTKNQNIQSEKYSQVKRFTEALAIEKSLDFAQVEKEREKVINQLTQNLNKSEIKSLVQVSLSYKVGNISHSGYYGHLKGVLSKAQISLKKYPHFDKYIQYVLSVDKIKPNQLFDQVELLKEAIINKFAVTQDQKALLELSENLRRIHKISKHQFSPDEWRHYQDRKQEILNVPKTLTKLAKKAHVDAQNISQKSENLKSYLETYEEFYTAASQRDKALAKNLQSKLVSIKESTGRSPPVVAMIAGGFHTPGLEKEFKKRDFSIVTVMPKIGKIGDHSDYMDVFSTEPRALEKMLLGEKLLLNGNSGLTAHKMTGMLDVENNVITSHAALYSGITRDIDEQIGQLNILSVQAVKPNVAHVTMTDGKEFIVAEDNAEKNLPEKIQKRLSTFFLKGGLKRTFSLYRLKAETFFIDKVQKTTKNLWAQTKVMIAKRKEVFVAFALALVPSLGFSADGGSYSIGDLPKYFPYLPLVLMGLAVFTFILRLTSRKPRQAAPSVKSRLGYIKLEGIEWALAYQVSGMSRIYFTGQIDDLRKKFIQSKSVNVDEAVFKKVLTDHFRKNDQKERAQGLEIKKIVEIPNSLFKSEEYEDSDHPKKLYWVFSQYSKTEGAAYTVEVLEEESIIVSSEIFAKRVDSENRAVKNSQRGRWLTFSAFLAMVAILLAPEAFADVLNTALTADPSVVSDGVSAVSKDAFTRFAVVFSVLTFSVGVLWATIEHKKALKKFFKKWASWLTASKKITDIQKALGLLGERSLDLKRLHKKQSVENRILHILGSEKKATSVIQDLIDGKELETSVKKVVKGPAASGISMGKIMKWIVALVLLWAISFDGPAATVGDGLVSFLYSPEGMLAVSVISLSVAMTLAFSALGLALWGLWVFSGKVINRFRPAVFGLTDVESPDGTLRVYKAKGLNSQKYNRLIFENGEGKEIHSIPLGGKDFSSIRDILDIKITRNSQYVGVLVQSVYFHAVRDIEGLPYYVFDRDGNELFIVNFPDIKTATKVKLSNKKVKIDGTIYSIPSGKKIRETWKRKIMKLLKKSAVFFGISFGAGAATVGEVSSSLLSTPGIMSTGILFALGLGLLGRGSLSKAGKFSQSVLGNIQSKARATGASLLKRMIYAVFAGLLSFMIVGCKLSGSGEDQTTASPTTEETSSNTPDPVDSESLPAIPDVIVPSIQNAESSDGTLEVYQEGSDLVFKNPLTEQRISREGEVHNIEIVEDGNHVYVGVMYEKTPEDEEMARKIPVIHIYVLYDREGNEILRLPSGSQQIYIHNVELSDGQVTLYYLVARYVSNTVNHQFFWYLEGERFDNGQWVPYQETTEFPGPIATEVPRVQSAESPNGQTKIYTEAFTSLARFYSIIFEKLGTVNRSIGLAPGTFVHNITITDDGQHAMVMLAKTPEDESVVDAIPTVHQVRFYRIVGEELSRIENPSVPDSQWIYVKDMVLLNDRAILSYYTAQLLDDGSWALVGSDGLPVHSNSPVYTLSHIFTNEASPLAYVSLDNGERRTSLPYSAALERGEAFPEVGGNGVEIIYQDPVPKHLPESTVSVDPSAGENTGVFYPLTTDDLYFPSTHGLGFVRPVESFYFFIKPKRPYYQGLVNVRVTFHYNDGETVSEVVTIPSWRGWRQVVFNLKANPETDPALQQNNLQANGFSVKPSAFDTNGNPLLVEVEMAGPGRRTLGDAVEDTVVHEEAAELTATTLKISEEVVDRNPLTSQEFYVLDAEGYGTYFTPGSGIGNIYMLGVAFENPNRRGGVARVTSPFGSTWQTAVSGTLTYEEWTGSVWEKRTQDLVLYENFEAVSIGNETLPTVQDDKAFSILWKDEVIFLRLDPSASEGSPQYRGASLGRSPIYTSLTVEDVESASSPGTFRWWGMGAALLGTSPDTTSGSFASGIKSAIKNIGAIVGLSLFSFAANAATGSGISTSVLSSVGVMSAGALSILALGFFALIKDYLGRLFNSLLVNIQNQTGAKGISFLKGMRNAVFVGLLMLAVVACNSSSPEENQTTTSPTTEQTSTDTQTPVTPVLSPDGTMEASYYIDPEVHEQFIIIKDLSGNELNRISLGSTRDVRELEFSPNGEMLGVKYDLLARLGSYGTEGMRVFRIDDGVPMTELFFYDPQRNRVTNINMVMDDQGVEVTYQPVIRIEGQSSYWQLGAEDTILYTFFSQDSSAITPITSPDGTMEASYYIDPEVHEQFIIIKDLSGNELNRIAVGSAQVRAVRELEFSPNGEMLGVKYDLLTRLGSSGTEGMRAFRVDDGQPVTELFSLDPQGNRITNINMVMDDQGVEVTYQPANRIGVSSYWQLGAEDTILYTFFSQDSSAITPITSPDDTIEASYYFDPETYEQYIIIKDLNNNGEEINRIAVGSAQGRAVRELEFSPNGEMIGVEYDLLIRLGSSGTEGMRVFRIDNGVPMTELFSRGPQGTRVTNINMVMDDQGVEVAYQPLIPIEQSSYWQLGAEDTIRYTFPQNSSAITPITSPDGTREASYYIDPETHEQYIIIKDLDGNDLNRISVGSAYMGAVREFEYNPNGEMIGVEYDLLTRLGGYDAEGVRVFRVNDGQPVTELFFQGPEGNWLSNIDMVMGYQEVVVAYQAVVPTYEYGDYGNILQWGLEAEAEVTVTYDNPDVVVTPNPGEVFLSIQPDDGETGISYPLGQGEAFSETGTGVTVTYEDPVPFSQSLATLTVDPAVAENNNRGIEYLMDPFDLYKHLKSDYSSPTSYYTPVETFYWYVRSDQDVYLRVTLKAYGNLEINQEITQVVFLPGGVSGKLVLDLTADSSIDPYKNRPSYFNSLFDPSITIEPFAVDENNNPIPVEIQIRGGDRTTGAGVMTFYASAVKSLIKNIGAIAGLVLFPLTASAGTLSSSVESFLYSPEGMLAVSVISLSVAVTLAFSALGLALWGLWVFSGKVINRFRPASVSDATNQDETFRVYEKQNPDGETSSLVFDDPKTGGRKSVLLSKGAKVGEVEFTPNNQAVGILLSFANKKVGHVYKVYNLKGEKIAQSHYHQDLDQFKKRKLLNNKVVINKKSFKFRRDWLKRLRGLLVLVWSIFHQREIPQAWFSKDFAQKKKGLEAHFPKIDSRLLSDLLGTARNNPVGQEIIQGNLSLTRAYQLLSRDPAYREGPEDITADQVEEFLSALRGTSPWIISDEEIKELAVLDGYLANLLRDMGARYSPNDFGQELPGDVLRTAALVGQMAPPSPHAHFVKSLLAWDFKIVSEMASGQEDVQPQEEDPFVDLVMDIRGAQDVTDEVSEAETRVVDVRGLPLEAVATAFTRVNSGFEGSEESKYPNIQLIVEDERTLTRLLDSLKEKAKEENDIDLEEFIHRIKTDRFELEYEVDWAKKKKKVNVAQVLKDSFGENVGQGMVEIISSNPASLDLDGLNMELVDFILWTLNGRGFRLESKTLGRVLESQQLFATQA